MNEPTVYTDEQAALIDAHSHASALVQRYEHACSVLLEQGELRNRLEARREELERLREGLDRRIREHGLLPHDINVDREDLARLADRFREWIDDERHALLQQALAERESELADGLRALRDTVGDDALIREAEAAGRRMAERLTTG